MTKPFLVGREGYPSLYTMMSEKVAQSCVTTAAFIGLGTLVRLHYLSPYLLVSEGNTA